MRVARPASPKKMSPVSVDLGVDMLLFGLGL